MPGIPKQFNTHKHPQANHQPRQKAADRKLHAQARQDVYNELTLEQKIAALPPEPFSKKQRARLLAALEKRNTAPKAEPKTTGALTKGDLTIVGGETAPSNTKQQKQKKYMKGSK